MPRVSFVRGFPTEIALTLDEFLAHAPALFVTAPIQKVYLRLTGGEEDRLQGLRRLADSPYLLRLTHLDLDGGRIGDAGARVLAKTPHLHPLTHLDLSYNRMGDEGVRALAASPHLRSLTHLYLSGNRIGDGGVRALAASPHLRCLTHLYLSGNRIGDEGAGALMESPHLRDCNVPLEDNPHIGQAQRIRLARWKAAARGVGKE
jgi:hypothetical protein